MRASRRTAQVEAELLAQLFHPGVDLSKVTFVLDAEDFSKPEAQALWGDVQRWVDEEPDIPGDVVLHKARILPERYGGRAVLESLSKLDVMTTRQALEAAKTVKDMANRRRFVEACEEASQSALAGGDLDDVVTRLEGRFADLLDAGDEKDLSWEACVKRVAMESLARHEAVERGDPPRTIPLPFPHLQKRLRLERGELVILAARPGMGKSSMGLQMVAASEDAGLPVLSFQLEMTEAQTIARAGASRSAKFVDAQGAVLGGLDRESMASYMNALEGLSDWKGELVDRPGLTVEQIARRARAYKRQNQDLALIVVDHIGRVGKTNRSDSTYDATSHVSFSLKNLAKELDVVVLALAQLNRSLEARSDKRPTQADLRDSGKIEEDADVIMFLFRPGVYNDNVDQSVAQIIVAKQRQGESGFAHPLEWDAPRFLFREASRSMLDMIPGGANAG